MAPVLVDEDDNNMIIEHSRNNNWKGKSEILGAKPAPLAICIQNGKLNRGLSAMKQLTLDRVIAQ
jgi:hypothetical protein